MMLFLAPNLDIIFGATVSFSDAKTKPIVMLADIFSLTEESELIVISSTVTKPTT